MAKHKLSVGECDCCGEQVVWREADSGSLSYSCQHCDFRGYAPAHTDAARLIVGSLKPGVKSAETKPLPPEAPPAPPKVEAKVAPKKNGSIWDDLTKPKAAA